MTVQKHIRIPNCFINTIIEGDCRKIIQNIPSNSIQCIITSPPYFHTGWEKHDCLNGMISIEDTVQEYINTLADLFVELSKKLTFRGSMWVVLNEITFGNYHGIPHKFIIELQNRGLYLIHEYIWSHTPGSTFDYVFWISPFEYPYMNSHKGMGSDVWSFPEEYHPKVTFDMLSRDVIYQCLQFTTKKGDIVLDPFAGSGQVCLMSYLFKRKFIGIELTPDIRNIAIERLNTVIQTSNIDSEIRYY